MKGRDHTRRPDSFQPNRCHGAPPPGHTPRGSLQSPVLRREGGSPAPGPADAARREARHSSGRAGRRRETHHGASYRPSGRARPRGGPRAKPAGPSRGPFRAVQKSVPHTADFSTGYSGTGDCSEQRGGEHPYVVAQAAYLGQDAVLLAGEEVEVNVGHGMTLSDRRLECPNLGASGLHRTRRADRRHCQPPTFESLHFGMQNTRWNAGQKCAYRMVVPASASMPPAAAPRG